MSAAVRQVELALRAERTKQAHLRSLREECRALGLDQQVLHRLQASLGDAGEELELQRLELMINDALTQRRVSTRRHGRAA